MGRVTRAARRTADAAAETSVEDARAAVDAPAPGRGAGSGDPLIGDLRRAGLLPLLVLHFASAEPAYGNQLIERIAALTQRRAAREPEHDVPAAALARGPGARGGRVGAPGAPLAALLPGHRGGRGGAPAAGGRAGPAAGPDRRVDRGDPRRSSAADGPSAPASIVGPRTRGRGRGAVVRPAPLALVGRRLRPLVTLEGEWPRARRARGLGVPARRPRARARARRRLRDRAPGRRSRSRTRSSPAASRSPSSRGPDDVGDHAHARVRDQGAQRRSPRSSISCSSAAP